MMILYTDGDVTEGNQRGLISPFVWSERQASLLDIGPLHLEAYAVPRLLLSIDLHLSFEWLKSSNADNPTQRDVDEPKASGEPAAPEDTTRKSRSKPAG